MISNYKFIAEKIIEYSKGSHLTETKAKLLMEYITDPGFHPEIISKISVGAGKICDWIRRKVGDEVLAYRVIEYRRKVHKTHSHIDDPRALGITFTDEVCSLNFCCVYT
jgi:hypothetical protein